MTRWLKATVLGLIAVDLILAAWLWGHILLFPFGVNYGEAPLIDQAQRILAGQPLYKASFADPPYVIANYTPLYPLLIAGTRAATRLPWLQIGRLTSLVAALASAWVLGLLARRFSGSHFFGLLAAGLFLGHPYVSTWAAIARVDLLALALSVAGLWLVIGSRPSTMQLCLAILCLTASVYTRQTYLLAAPAAATIWLWHEDRRRAGVFAAALVATWSALFLLLNAGTHGGFYLNTVVANTNEYRIEQTLQCAARFLTTWPVVCCLAGFGVALSVWPRPGTAGKPTAEAARSVLRWGLVPYTIGAVLVAATVGKVGSDANYFLELIAAMAMWAVVGLAHFASWRPVTQRLVFAALLGQIGLMGLGNGQLYTTTIARQWERLSAHEALYRQVAAAAGQGPVLSDGRMDLIVLSGQRIYYQPFEYRQLELAGLWDASDLATSVRERRFPLIVIGGAGQPQEYLWSPAVEAAIAASYRPDPFYGNLQLYRPRHDE